MSLLGVAISRPLHGTVETNLRSHGILRKDHPMKTFSTFCAIAALSAVFLAAPAMAASCRDNTTVATGLGAIGGGALGAGVTHGSAGGVIGGAVIGGLVGNAVGRSNCRDRYVAPQQQNRYRNGRTRNRNSAYRNPGYDRRAYGRYENERRDYGRYETERRY